MLKPTLASLSLAIMPCISTAEPTTTQPGTTLVGLPVYSSDGHKLGEVTSTPGIGDKPALRAEMGTFLGLGPSIVLIDAEVFQKKADRIELTMTAAEVMEKISKQGAQPKQ